MSAPRVAHVNEAAVAGDTALVRGYSAWFIATALTSDYAVLEGLMSRLHVPADRRDDVRRSVAAIAEAGTAWRVAHAEATSTSGSAEGQGAEAPLRSWHVSRSPSLSSREAAAALGITDRQVRFLAASSGLPGERDAGGRWRFEAAVIEAEITRRREGVTA